MKLRFFTDKNGNKVYTLKEKIQDKLTQEAHYKFLKFAEKLNKITNL